MLEGAYNVSVCSACAILCSLKLAVVMFRIFRISIVVYAVSTNHNIN